MTTNEPEPVGDIEVGTSSWLYDHIGRLLGIAGGLLVFLVFVFLAIIGFTPALYVIVFVVSGLILIIGGGKIHRA